jgi:hypothetical protein
MSGPKDFDIDVAESLVSLFTDHRMQQQIAFDTRVSTLRSPRAPRRRKPAPRAPEQSTPSAQSTSPTTVHAGPSETVGSDAETAAAAAEVAAITDKFESLVEELRAKSTAIAELEHAKTTCASEYQGWEQRLVSLEGSGSSATGLANAEALRLEADALAQRILNVGQQLEQRRHVVKAILESFHAVGYFTDEPVEDASSPGGPITLVARKGGERVTVSLPIGDSMVKSNWDGSADDRCVDSFTKYITEMGKRGVACTPTRGLEDRPRLQQMGRKDLPKSQSQGG